jgi:hypothetical protein
MATLLPPHGSHATDPPCLSSTAYRGKISAKRDNRDETWHGMRYYGTR